MWSRFSHIRLCDPIDYSPPGYRKSPGKNTGVGCHALLQGSSQPRDQTCVSSISCIRQTGSLPIAPPSPCVKIHQFEEKMAEKSAPEISLPRKTRQQCIDRISVWFCNHLATLKPVKRLQLSGEALNDELWLISSVLPLWTAIATHLSPQPTQYVYMFLKQSTHSLWEPGWAKRTLSSKYWGFVLRLQTAASSHRSANKQA